MKKNLTALTFAATMALAIASAATAGPPPSRPGCPPSPDNESEPTSGWGLFHPIGDDAKFDKNGDGWICVKGIPGDGNSVTFMVGFNGATVKDNNGPNN